MPPASGWGRGSPTGQRGCSRRCSGPPSSTSSPDLRLGFPAAHHPEEGAHRSLRGAGAAPQPGSAGCGSAGSRGHGARAACAEPAQPPPGPRRPTSPVASRTAKPGDLPINVIPAPPPRRRHPPSDIPSLLSRGSIPPPAPLPNDGVCPPLPFPPPRASALPPASHRHGALGGAVSERQR